MRTESAQRSRLFISLPVLWVLAWSLFRMLRYRQEMAQSKPSVSLLYWSLVAVVGLMTVGCALVTLLFWFRRSPLAPFVLAYAKRSRVAYWSVWLVPALLWTLGFVLYRLGTPIAASLMDGPALVLAFAGLAALLYLVKHFYAESGEDERDLSDEPVRSTGLNPLSRSLPAGLVTPAAILALAVTAVLIFRDSLFDPQSIVFGHDVLKLHYMTERFIREALQAGQLPLWNPYIFSGGPAMSHPQYLFFYPPQMLLRLLPLNLSLSWTVALHVCLAGIGMFALCRRLRMEPWIALTCGLVCMLNSGLLLRVYAGHVQLFFALAWFPLVWLLVMVALDTGRVAALAGAAVGMAMIILTGHPAFPLYMFMFLGLYWLYVCCRLWRKAGSPRLIGLVTARFMAMVVVAIGLSAIQLVPSAVMAGQTSLAGGYDPSKANLLTLSPHELLAILIPRFYTTPGKWKYYWELVPYLGVLFVLLLPLLFAAKARPPLVRFLGIIALLSLALALGDSLGLFSVLHFAVPLFRLSRIPPRALVLWILAITVLGGFGLQAVSRRSVDLKWFTLGTGAYVAGSLFILGCAAGHWLNITAALSDRLSPGGLPSAQLAVVGLASILLVALFGARFFLQRLSIRHLVSLALCTLLGFLAGVLIVPEYPPLADRLVVLGLLLAVNVMLLRLLYVHGPAPLSVLLLAALVCFDLGLFSLPHIAPVHPPTFYEDERVVLSSTNLQGFGRVVSTGGEPDKYMLGYVSHVDGYVQGIPRGYDAFLRSNSKGSPTDTSYILSPDSKVDPAALDFLGVEYIIESERNHDDELELIASQNGHYLYRNLNALPRAFVVYDVQVVDALDSAIEALRDKDFDYARSVVLSEAPEIEPGSQGRASVSIDEYLPSSGNLVMTVHTSEPGVLVTSEPYYTERRVWVDGQEVKLLTANAGFCAVSLSAGRHRVELRYVPVSFYVGSAISALTILACAGVVLLSRAYSRRRETPRAVIGIQKDDLDSGA
ncbi:YfhO family protein [Chloroflexota bacterium]